MKHVAVKSLLSVMLSLMMVVVFTPAIAFADEPEATDEMQPAIADELVEEDVAAPAEDIQVPQPVDISDYDAALTETSGGLFGFDQPARVKKGGPAKSVSGSVVLTNVASWQDWGFADSSAISFAREDSNVNGYYYVQQMEIGKGVVGIEEASSVSMTNDQKAKVAFFYDAACTKKVDGYVTVDSNGGSYYFKIPKTGTYYIGIGASNADWGAAPSMDVNFYACHYAQAKKGTTLKADKVYAVRCGAGKTTTVKYKPAAAGAMYVTTELDSKIKTTVKSKSGKTLAAQKSRKIEPNFGVKRTTYKLSINSYKKSKMRGYIFSVSNAKIPNQSGSSKGKAKTLSQDAPKVGRIVTGSTKSQWFKFKNTKKEVFYVEAEGYTNYKLKFEFYKGKSKLVKWTTYLAYNTESNGWILTAKQPMPKGTYYVKVTPYKKSCGVYMLGWGYVE